MHTQRISAFGWVCALAYVTSLPCLLAGQVAPSQAKGNPNAPTPLWDVFVGYSILDPRGTFYPIQPDGSVLPISFKLEKAGTMESASYFFHRNVGVLVESGQHDLMTNTGFTGGSSNSGILTVESGLIYRWPGVHLTPFVHGFGGGADVDGPDHEPYTWGPVVGGGGGLDWYFGCHFGVRLFEVDYEYFHVNSGVSHGTLAADDFVWGDDENINAIRAAAGLVVRGASAYSPTSGCGPLPPVALACVAVPGGVFPGELVTITATPSGLNPKLHATYIWTGSGVTGSDGTATVATETLAPGTYTVRAAVSEGPKAGESANCQASFVVKPFEAPTLACVAGPMTINPDQTSSITLTAMSPQNRPLTYACTSTTGTVAMDGNVGTFHPAPGQTGPMTVNCTATDDKGKTATCETGLTILKPTPPLVRYKPVCPIDFNKDALRPTRVDNEAKACLDDVALDLQHDPEVNLVVVGEQTAAEPAGTAAQRAVNTKEYLETEKGIDPSRITVVTGSEGDQQVQQYLGGAGADFNSTVPGTTPVDEKVVRPVVRKPLAMSSHATKKTDGKSGKMPAATPPVKKPVDGP